MDLQKLQAQVIRDDQIRDLVKDLAGICNSICDFGQFAHRSQLDAAVKEARPLMEKLENILSSRAAEVKGGFNSYKSGGLPHTHKIAYSQFVHERQHQTGTR